MNRKMLHWAGALLLPFAAGLGRAADDAAKPAARFEDLIEARVREHVLKNGLRLLVLERHEVPVVSFVTMCNVGAVDEHVGITGVAHIFEHMAFKGSREIGVTDPQGEAAAMERLDQAFEALKAERAKGEQADIPPGAGGEGRAPEARRLGGDKAKVEALKADF